MTGSNEPFVRQVINDPEMLGNLVRYRRISVLGLRQADLAARARVGVRFVSELERGKPTVELGKVMSVLDSLGLYLVLEKKPEPPGRGNAFEGIKLTLADNIDPEDQ